MIWGACLADTAFLKATPFEVSGDDFEETTDGATVNGLNSGYGWESTYTTGTYAIGEEDFESYNDGDNLSGASGGTGFTGNWYAA